MSGIDEENKEKIFLSSLELSQINNNTEKHINFEKNKEIVELKLHIIKLKKLIYEGKINELDKDIDIIGYQKIQQNQTQKDFIEKSKETLLKISNNYFEIKDKKWGFDPESGEIIFDN